MSTAKEALAALSKAMQEDPEYAWSWHCNIAMMAQDAGALHRTANERAADFMKLAFSVDIRGMYPDRFPQTREPMEDPEGFAEMRRTR